MIHLLALSSATIYAWTRVGHEQGWLDEANELRTWIDVEFAAILFFRLRRTEDKADYFPRGKAKSLQQLETLIDKALEEGT